MAVAVQHTISKAGSLTGIGLHTGVKATVTINPAPENFGIRFVRTDLPNCPEILADIDNVVENSLNTTIGIGTARVYTIEHIMSAFAGMGIDNCRVEVSGQEIPLMDGSALPFVKLIKEVGICQQEAQREYLVIDKPMLLYNKGDIALSVYPAEHFHITLMIEYKHPAIGAQHTSMFLSLNDYETDYAPARTFCFLSDIEKMREQGLIKGGSIHNAVVVQDVDLTKERLNHLKTLFKDADDVVKGENGFLNNTKLFFPNELCRHKTVDLIGDLYLLGKPLRGHVLGARTGHAANIEMAKKIREYIKTREEEKRKLKKFDFKMILDLLPHRYPFLLVDSIRSLEPEKRIVAVKNVSFNEPFFQGHFPGNPIMPGVLHVEAMAQAGGILALYTRNNSIGKKSTLLFCSIEKVKFRNQVRPGDCLVIEVELVQKRGKTMRFAGKCFVNETLTTEADFLAMIED
ncbi:MAG: bifunctional UDP-3-O-[3-hydroxymyristoyl] N-acetylglucosamine deacetylase/3-hydroxyacyl-ACP dehydratase [Chitinivibrionales bacterium]|nr:bifunctional UDP-3-O-[3-hydroxymyristoyl] N-acetylglucosamine deacetylase/3-hydroxyacyl-ACP dehydratase [Chitinivibrionales bacterium]